jgi:hypothetical protein
LNSHFPKKASYEFRALSQDVLSRPFPATQSRNEVQCSSSINDCHHRLLPIKKRLPSDSAKREKVIHAIVLIHNFRTDIVGCNQIKAVFDPEYEKYLSIEGHNKIYHYYFQPGDYISDSGDDN